MSDLTPTNLAESDENPVPTWTVTIELVSETDDHTAMKEWLNRALADARHAEGFALDDWSLDPHDGAGPR